MTSPPPYPPRNEGEGLDAFFEAIIEGISAGAANALQSVFGNPTPTCCDDLNSKLSPKRRHQHRRQQMDGCYWPGSTQIYDFDVNTMNCIINLHYKQDDKRIDIAGSVCAAGYGGGLMRGQMECGGGNIRADQLSAVDSATLQAAAWSMLNVGVSYSDEIKRADYAVHG